MASTYSVRLRIDYQAPGDNLNTWGARLNTNVFQLLEDAVARRVALTVSGPVTLTSNNGSTDQARCAFLDCTGTGGTVTAPASEKIYLVRNGCSGSVVVTTGGGRTATFLAGEVAFCVCDASNYDRLATQSFGAGPFTMAGALDMGAHKITSVTDPTNPQDAATKAYADALAFTANAGILPGQVGSAGKMLTTDGVTASWHQLVTADVSGFSAAASVVRTGTNTTAALTPGDTYNALAEVTLTYAATVTPDMATFINAALTLTGNVTLANPTNPKVGQSGFIRLVQDGTGSRLLSAVGSSWKRGGGVPTLTTTASATDVLVYQVLTPTYILYDIVRNPS